MDITETNGYYVVSFFPNAEEVEIDDKPEKGYKAIIGLQDNEHVVMKVMYAKSMYDLNKVIELAGNIRECPICNELNANVGKVGTIQLQDQYTTRAAQVMPEVPIQTSSMLNTGNPFQDLMAQLMFDTKLNNTGQVLVATALEDNVLMAKAMPTTVEGLVTLVADITDYASGKGNIFRSPKEVTEFVKALREGVKSPEEKKKKDDAPVVFRRASTVIVS